MRWLLSLHLIAIICWFAGLFYLPRLFVYHAMTTDSISNARFKIMERKLYWGIMTPSAIIAIISGLCLIYFYVPYDLRFAWMHAKLGLVTLLVIFHIYCGILLRKFYHDRNTHGHRFYRWLNEVPTLLLIGIIIFVIVKP